MNRRATVVVIAGGLLAGCPGGVRFAPAPINMPLPETFTQRSVYPGAVSGYDFQDLVGNILFLEPSKDPLRIGLIRPANYTNAIIPITESHNYYRSRIQKGAEAQGSYLVFAAAFSADDMAELTLDDIARAGIEFVDEATWSDIKNQVTAWVQRHPKSNPNSTRLWVKSVVLSRRVYNGHTKIEANASGQVGDVAGVKTGIYRKDENAIKSVTLGFEAFDLDRLAGEVGKARMRKLAPRELIELSRYTGMITGTLRSE